jgi:glycogen debranching enzyme
MTTQSYLRTATRCAWRGPSLLVLDTDGWAGRHGLTGYYFREARFLRTLRLELFGERPYLCSLSDPDPPRIEAIYLYPPVSSRGGGGTGSGGTSERHGILARGIDLDVTYRVRAASLEVNVLLTSRWNLEAEIELAFVLDADFADLQEALDGRRRQEAGVRADPCDGGVAFRYEHEKLPLETRATITGGHFEWRDGRLVGHTKLGRQQSEEIRLTVRPDDARDPIDAEGELARERHIESWEAGLARVGGHADVPLAGMTNQAVSDLGSLALLEGEPSQWLAPAAGIPLYPAFFGRDALTAGWQASIFDRGRMLEAAYERSRDLQGGRIDPWRDEEPGRVVQQARMGPLARLGLDPFDRYYGDVASPLMFLVSLGEIYAFTGDRDLIARHWEDAKRTLEWARRFGDFDGDGYIEYETLSPRGPEHQAWKDSDNSVVDETGRQVDAPLATCEVQGYWYAALQIMSVLAVVMGEIFEARRLWKEAAELKHRFNRDFWMPDHGFVAFGLGPDKRPIRSMTSNAAQCLTSGIIDRDRVPLVVKRLFEPDLFSGWGIRTLSTRNPAYNPVSYHLGSVWPAENATVTLGLRRYGFEVEAARLTGAIYDLARLWDGGRIPECIGGYARDARVHPGCYPHANSPQAWNQSVFPIILQSIAGMQPLASLRMLALDPALPEWLPELEIYNLDIGGARIDLRFYRDRKGKSRYRILRKHGTLRVVRQPPLDALTVGPWGRLGVLVKDLLRIRTKAPRLKRTIGAGAHRRE